MLKQSILFALLYSLSYTSEIANEVHNLAQKTEDNMVFVKGGSFMMGDPLFINNESGEYGDERQIIGSPENKKKYPNAKWEPTTFGFSGKGQHQVTLSDFYMQKYMVTWAEFDVYFRDQGIEEFKKSRIGRRDWREPNHAVWTPSWKSAKDYCQWLGKQTGKNYDLPTEAQWEYAARSRGNYVFWATNDGSGNNGTGNSFGKMQNIAYDEAPVGTMPSNPLGLYDMSSGFRYEWVNDWYDENYYKSTPEVNPKGPTSGTLKVLRNSGDSGNVGYIVIYGRWYSEPNEQSQNSFRCVVNP